MTGDRRRPGSGGDALVVRARPEPAAWTSGLERSAMEEMLAATSRPGILSLALGLPSPDLFPREALGELAAGLIAADARSLQYGPPSSELRDFVARLMQRRGAACRPEEVFLTAGAQQGMSLIARLLLDPGATIVVEERCYTGFLQAVAPASPRVMTVPTRAASGIDLDALETVLGTSPRPSLIYVVPDGHNPMGVSIPTESRSRLVEMARAHGVPILEDDAYGHLSYDGDELPALRALDPEWVFHVGSFSKTLAPALRTGWIAAPERFAVLLSSLKESSDINTATFGQRAVAAFVATGRFDDHVERLKKEYTRRRDAMLSAMERQFPPGTSWSVPRAGFFTWVELPGVDTVELLREAMDSEAVAFLPGNAFRAGDSEPARSALRLSFSFCGPELIEEGVGRVARAIGRLTERGGGMAGHA